MRTLLKFSPFFYKFDQIKENNIIYLNQVFYFIQNSNLCLKIQPF